MNGTAVLVDGYERVRGAVHGVLDGLSTADLNARLDGSNSIAWLVWHLTRVQDDHVADASGLEQVWLAQGWKRRFALPLPAGSTGYGHGGEEVAAVRVDSADPLLGYHDAVHEQTVGWLSELDPAELTSVIDEAWDPPVTLGVRLVSVLADDLELVGQAAFLRGVLERG
ncbi:mycothiol transferase [Streptomyces sp. TP-A0874]|uniref:mycothiol transferase n=1 Tax=Streptomyces sp. TP-A0874 TaxID=549819 RepID=UPI0008535249|nr:DinB family protein [Streptomyces sp. TP-A0874]